MGYYGCNKVRLERTARDGQRVIVVHYHIEELRPPDREEVFIGWDARACAQAFAFAQGEFAQLSM